ncbi:MAG TPA: hypothetical protein VMB35_02060 [Methanomicrobiales archaeon]|nr:hypothetical protein [Methanomicrobiales archaeon]
MFIASKPVTEERTGRFLDEIDRAEKIFRKMCDGGELEEEISRVQQTKKSVVAMRRTLR